MLELDAICGDLSATPSDTDAPRPMASQPCHRSYFQTCRSGAGLLEAVDTPSHLCSDPNLFSLEEVRGPVLQCCTEQ